MAWFRVELYILANLLTLSSSESALSSLVWGGSVRGWPTLAEIDGFVAAARRFAPDVVAAPRLLGQSVEGRPITAVCLGTSCVSPALPSAPAVLLTALTHPREPMGLIAVLSFAVSLLEGRAARPNGTEAGILETRQVWLMPAMNPDGYQWNLAQIRAHARPNVDLLVRKNRRRGKGDTGACSAATMGVDLNRNFPVCFAKDEVGSSLKPCQEDFRGGVGALSEPESIALVALVSDPKLAFGAAVNYHSFGKYINLPYMCKSKGTPPARDYGAFKHFAHEATLRNGYKWGHPWESGFLYTVNGDVSDYLYEHHKLLAVSPEVGPADPVASDLDGFLPAPSQRRGIAEGTLAISLLAAQMAGPHLVPTITVAAVRAKAGDEFAITATIWVANVGSKPSSATTRIVATVRVATQLQGKSGVGKSAAQLGVVESRSVESRSAVLTAHTPLSSVSSGGSIPLVITLALVDVVGRGRGARATTCVEAHVSAAVTPGRPAATIPIAPSALRRSARCALPAALADKSRGELARETALSDVATATALLLAPSSPAQVLPTLPSVPHPAPGAHHTAPRAATRVEGELNKLGGNGLRLKRIGLILVRTLGLLALLVCLSAVVVVAYCNRRGSGASFRPKKQEQFVARGGGSCGGGSMQQRDSTAVKQRLGVEGQPLMDGGIASV